MRGMVLGLPRSEWELVAAAFPEWDLSFARRSADLDEIVRDIVEENRTLIVGEMANRKVLDVKQSVAALPTWHLSRAPLPTIEGAYGYILEAGSSWRGARRETEMERLAVSGALETLPRLWPRMMALRDRLALTTDPQGPRLLIAPDGRRLANAKMALEALVPKGDDVVFTAHLQQPWWHDDVQRQFAKALSTCRSVLSDGHPIAARAVLLATPHETHGRAFWLNPASRNTRSAGIEREPTPLFAAMLTLARYVKDDGELFDPLNLVDHT